jgi:hypothetical protein
VTEPDAPPAAPADASPEAEAASGPDSFRADPEDWASTSGEDDEPYTRERPPHWE